METYPPAEAREQLGRLVARGRESHEPIAISEGGEPVAALVSLPEPAELQCLRGLSRQ
ncbi:type II toxin-antitoxin system Phd/YefM family antitoxin [Streptomyces orinoci]|uniref:Antitoxin n=1 Tax=Streptomyces orinoci TaxID=67339 RepID=A0ABV3K1J0_STRON|nr:type II toxin-antitoxin system Phd/YefM family antitoxin [Streptomyces orinoci]